MCVVALLCLASSHKNVWTGRERFGSVMARYIWVVRALSPRDGGWVRCIGKWFKSEEDAWEMVLQFWPLMVNAGNYVTIEVVKTIAFRELSFFFDDIRVR